MLTRSELLDLPTPADGIEKSFDPVFMAALAERLKNAKRCFRMPAELDDAVTEPRTLEKKRPAARVGEQAVDELAVDEPRVVESDRRAEESFVANCPRRRFRIHFSEFPAKADAGVNVSESAQESIPSGEGAA